MAALAFDHFARRQVDIAVIETGLGGRLDATNVLSPEVAVITDISFDHTEILGPTLAAIAGEKAGIIKPGIPTVIGRLPGEASRVIQRVCRERKSELIRLHSGDYTKTSRSPYFNFGSNGFTVRRIKPALPGDHQRRNIALVLKTVEQLRRRGYRIPVKSIRDGLAETSWPGRFQVLSRNGDGPTVVLDVCHNTGGAVAFARTFRREFPGRRARFLLGLVKRKEHQEIVDALGQVAESFWLVPMQTKRSMDVKSLREGLDWHGKPIRSSARLETAWRRMVKEAGPDDIIAVVGSHYLVGEYLGKYGRGG